MIKTVNTVFRRDRRTRYKPSPRECALLFLKLIEEREGRRKEKEGGQKKVMTRAQISEGSLKRLWKRERLSEQLLEEVQDWLLSAGWALFYAGGIYGAVKTDAVGNWPTLASSRIHSVLAKVALGDTEVFEELESLLAAGENGPAADAHEEPDEETEEDPT
jgi:hypothetical protein